MPSQSVVIVIGLAIVVNLVIMGLLVVTLVARRRDRPAAREGIAEPPAYRLAAVAAPPTAFAPATPLIDFRTSRPTEDEGQTVTATDSSDARRFRPVMSDEGHRAEATIASFFSGGSTGTGGGSEPPSYPPVAGPAAGRDSLTGLEGGLAWDNRVREEDARLARYRRLVTVVLVELDGLDRLIARFGTEAADRLVPPVGETLARQARETDKVARIGDGRFAVMLPETDEIQAINYVERIRAECDRWLAAGAITMRLAIGWACPAPGSDLKAAIRIADDRLNADRRRLGPLPDPAPPSSPPPATPGERPIERRVGRSSPANQYPAADLGPDDAS